VTDRGREAPGREASPGWEADDAAEFDRLMRRLQELAAFVQGHGHWKVCRDNGADIVAARQALKRAPVPSRPPSSARTSPWPPDRRSCPTDPQSGEGVQGSPHGARPRSRGALVALPVRTYLVTNARALFGPGARIVVTSSAPAGSVLDEVVRGRAVRVELTDTPLPAYGDVYAAELQLPRL
jgi:hypothetical protein